MAALAETVRDLEAVTWEMERRGLIAPDFGAWMAKHRPEHRWDARHFRAMQEVLDRVTAGEVKRVIFQVPIRHGKTEHNTYGYAAYHFARNPRFRLLLGSYNSTQVKNFSRRIRKLVKELGVDISGEKDAADEWETAAGGGLRAVGAGAGVASVNADGIIIDDPIGSRADAESRATRGHVYDWLTNDMFARAEPHTWIIITMSRWHEDDPVGRLLDQQAGQWHLVDLPAVAEDGDPLGRREGEALWPQERDEEWLAQKRIELGPYGFASLLQLRPRPRGGGMFEWDWWRILDEAPKQTRRIVRYWDLAGTLPTGGSSDPDWTVGTLAARMDDDRTVVLHQAAFRLGVAARDARILEIAKADRARYGLAVEWWIETEAGIAGRDRTDALKRRIQAVGVKVSDEPATGQKHVRAEPLASAAEAGNVVLGPDDPVEPWHDAFRLEAADFPFGRHDDRVDSAAGAFNKLAVEPVYATTTIPFRTY